MSREVIFYKFITISHKSIKHLNKFRKHGEITANSDTFIIRYYFVVCLFSSEIEIQKNNKLNKNKKNTRFIIHYIVIEVTDVY